MISCFKCQRKGEEREEKIFLKAFPPVSFTAQRAVNSSFHALKFARNRSRLFLSPLSREKAIGLMKDFQVLLDNNIMAAPQETNQLTLLVWKALVFLWLRRNQALIGKEP